jgi:hypothetical protein
MLNIFNDRDKLCRRWLPTKRFWGPVGINDQSGLVFRVVRIIHDLNIRATFATAG